MDNVAVAGGSAVASLTALSWPVHDDCDKERLLAVLHSGRWSWMGEMETAFNEAWAKFNDSRYSLLVTNGTHALQLAYEAFDIGYGDEVIVPGLTWQATAAAALDLNAIPVLVDISPDTWCLDPGAAEAAITPKTRMIVCVHLYGRMTDMDALKAVARRHQLPIVEDCAHQHGSQWRGKRAGTIGDIGAYSFQLSKLMTCGEGGGILVQEDELYYRLDQLRNCGRPSPHAPVGARPPLQSGGYRITEWQAAILLGQLERLPAQLAKREASGRRLDQVLQEAPGVSPLGSHEGVTRQSAYCYGFRFHPTEWEGVTRDAFCEALTAETGLTFAPPYQPLNRCDLYQPQTKKRHRISDEYWAAIDPTRFELPVATRVAGQEGVVTPHQTLLLPPEKMEVIGEAIAKLHTQREELRRWAEARGGA